MWPAEILFYLEKNIIFALPETGSAQRNFTEINKAAAIGQPSIVLACTDLNGRLEYMCEWANGFSRKLLSSAECPEIIIRYLQSNIDFNKSKFDNSTYGKNFNVSNDYYMNS